MKKLKKLKLNKITEFLLFFLGLVFLFLCIENSKYRKKNKDNTIIVNDTTIYGVIKSIEKIKIKKELDVFYKHSNKIVILSDNIYYSTHVNKTSFEVDDSVKLVIKRVKFNEEINDIKLTIYPTFGEKIETYNKLKIEEK